MERVEEEFRTAFPAARIAIASSDTFSGPTEAQSVLRAFAARDLDVIIGTQIVAKGHHFPQLTLAGIVDADLGGGAGDPRAAERSFQLLHQVSGRSGRGEKPGLVLIQTRNPDDAVDWMISGDGMGFKLELQMSNMLALIAGSLGQGSPGSPEIAVSLDVTDTSPPKTPI